MLNFEWYRTFKAIYQAGTLTGAAQELLISQPNVSQHLSALEAYVGKQLFERPPRILRNANGQPPV
jgi:DNA-binding transcriptional LysR family regulator